MNALGGVPDSGCVPAPKRLKNGSECFVCCVGEGENKGTIQLGICSILARVACSNCSLSMSDLANLVTLAIALLPRAGFTSTTPRGFKNQTSPSFAKFTSRHIVNALLND